MSHNTNHITQHNIKQLYLLSSQTHPQARDVDASSDKTHTFPVSQSYFTLVVAAPQLSSQGYFTSSEESRKTKSKQNI